MKRKENGEYGKENLLQIREGKIYISCVLCKEIATNENKKKQNK